MNKVKVLIEGYAKPLDDDGWEASSTTTLIKTDSGLQIIIDPGANKHLLLQRLGENKLQTGEINYVFMTHYHPDHILLCSIFDNAIFFDGETMFEEDKETAYEGGVLPMTDIRVIATPGHAYENCSLLVPTEDFGLVAVAADVFWWTTEEDMEIDRESLLAREDPFVKDPIALRKSRELLLEKADWIIPGHGPMWKVKK